MHELEIKWAQKLDRIISVQDNEPNYRLCLNSVATPPPPPQEAQKKVMLIYIQNLDVPVRWWMKEMMQPSRIVSQLETSKRCSFTSY